MDKRREEKVRSECETGGGARVKVMGGRRVGRGEDTTEIFMDTIGRDDAKLIEIMVFMNDITPLAVEFGGDGVKIRNYR